MSRTTFEYEPRLGDVIRGDVRMPAGPGPEPRTAIVVVHGFKGFKDWGFFPYASDRLAAAGHAVVSFNFSRNGVGADLETFSELEKFGANTFTLELDELRGIIGRVADGDLLGWVPEGVGVLGHSRGGGQAVLAAAEDEHVGSLVTWAAIASFDRWTDETKEEWRREGRIWIPNLRTRQEMPLDLTLLEDLEANRGRLNILDAARRLHAPWLVVHGLEDETVNVADGRALVAAASAAEARWIGDAGHTFEAQHPFAGAPPELERAIEATLGHFARTLRP